MTATRETQRLTAQMHDAIAALSAHLTATEPGFTGTFDYRVDLHRHGSGAEVLLYRAD